MSITNEEMKEIVAAAVAAARAPNELEQMEIEARRAEREAQRVQIEQDQQIRADTARQQIAIAQNKRNMQKVCTHKHRRGDTHCVFITDDLGGYILCQKCQAVVRPGVEPSKNKAGVIYDSTLFNHLFQDCASNGMWG